MLLFLAGLGAGAFLLLLILMVTTFLPERNRKSIPLNPELIEFWRISISQKKKELDWLENIWHALREGKGL
jgi:hypothetical protein